MADKFAVITGASTGIGFELASIAAEQGHDLLVIANEPLIDAAASDFRRHGVEVRSVQADLATIDGVSQLLDAAGGRQIDVLCANAGHGLGRAFIDQRPEEWRHVIDTNVTGTVYLLQKVLQQMVACNDGKILVTGSIAGYMPGTFNAVYNATKAFIDNFTDALRNEIRDREGVSLTTLMPGPTEAEFFDRAGLMDTKVGQQEKDDPAKVARDGWDAMIKGEAHIVTGWKNKIQKTVANVTPASALAEMHRSMAEPGTAEDA